MVIFVLELFKTSLMPKMVNVTWVALIRKLANPLILTIFDTLTWLAAYIRLYPSYCQFD